MQTSSLFGRPGRVVVAAGLVVFGHALAVRGAGTGPYIGAGDLDLYTVTVEREGLQDLAIAGFDMTEARPVADAATGLFEVALVLSPGERERLRGTLGIEPRLWRTAEGLSFSRQADRELDAADQTGGFQVWRPYDGDTGILAELDKIASDHPGIVQRVVVGQTVQGRDIVALRVTKDAATTPEGSRPAVLYNALQHAREWIAVEVNRRLLRHFVDNYGKDEAVTQLVDAIELWFIPVANPDGYQFTFTEGRRLWRKNMRDNNGDGEVGNGDGVDMNRNFDARWNYDTEGSSGNMGGETYRGPSPGSEPEVKALQDLLKRVDFTFLINYHSAAQLILYPEGWQDQTRVADDPIFTALAGDFFNPAIPGFLPELSSGLYITNGETCDFADTGAGTLCYTPELSTPPQGSVPPGTSGFQFPDNEALIQAEFEKNLPFALDIARSTADPTVPRSHLGNTTRPMYAESFAVSYGDPQPVQGNVLRRLGDARMAFRINGGAVTKVPAAEWDGGERYGDSGDIFYRRVRGTVSGAKPGDEVAVWFEAGGQSTEPFTYRLVSDSGKPVLLVAAEDYTGSLPTYAKTDGPTYLDVYKDALNQNDYAYDVYDVDANGRVAPSQLGVLGHYRAVVWYTGDDIAPRTTEMVNGTVSRQARDMMLAVRGFLNEGGKLLYAGGYVGSPYARGWEYDPVADKPCVPNSGADGCEYLSNDFLQYYLGMWSFGDLWGIQGARLVGTSAPFEGVTMTLKAEPMTAKDHGVAIGITSQQMPAEQYPIFTSRGAASFENAGPKPTSGQQLLYSGSAPYKFMRLGRTLDLTQAKAAQLKFWAARRTVQQSAFFVEARDPDAVPPPSGLSRVYLPLAQSGEAPEGPMRGWYRPGWTTLPEATGRTTRNAGLGCGGNNGEAWFRAFPQLAHYMARIPNPNNPMQFTCRNGGTTGDWNGATGNSAGWESWTVDLSGYTGKRVEVALTYLIGQQAGAGVIIDDLQVIVDGAPQSTASFEDDLGGWTASGLPANEQPADLTWTRATAAALPPVQGTAAVATEDTLTLGFGLENVAAAEDRAALVRRALAYLGVMP